MRPDLYRCSVALLLSCFSVAGAGYGQEISPTLGSPTLGSPTSGSQLDFPAASPFADDDFDPLALPPEATLAPAIQPAPPMPESARVFSHDRSSAMGHGPTLDRLHDPILRRDLKINGAQSCATSNCHAGPRPGVAQPSARRGSEYQIWIENDPHAQSWRTICSDESVAMMKRLEIMVGDQIVDQAGLDNCLACHNSVQQSNEPRRELRGGELGADSIQHSASIGNRFLREGVGCSGCHGPSEQWINTHFQYHWSPQGATDQGFVEAGDLYVRARMCASCHVGDKDRDMNHDIIAAGHPTLRYELATFHAWQPKHWRDAESADKSFYEAQLWLAGQVAATDASLALLEARSADALHVSRWPELAAYDCASCHHNLGLDNARRPIGDARKATAIYSGWNDAGLRWLIDHRIETGEATEEDSELLAALDAVKATMEETPEPNRHAVSAAATQARQALARWFDGTAGIHERHVFRSDRLGRMIASAAGQKRTFESWESAVQFYLAAVAARESWPGGWNGPLRDVADRMRYGLRYPEMIDVSRYAKRDGNGPTATRIEAMSLGIELAGWLGPVQPEMMLEDEDDDPQDARRRLRQLIEEINSRWEARRRQREAAETTGDVQDEIETTPRRQPKTAEELLEERRRNRGQQAGSNDSP